MSNAKRIPSLDGLRGIAAIAAMLFHFDYFYLPQARITDILPFVSRSYLAVDLFFLLSGFVMAHVYGRGLASNWRAHWLRFAIARFARIYPLFALTALTIMSIVALSGIEPPLLVSFSSGSLVLQPFLLQQWAPDLSWNYPSWSISTETEAYILFVFLAGPLVIGKHPRLIAACCVATVVVLSIAHGGSLNLFHGSPALLRTLAEFSLGVLLYRAHIYGLPLLRRWAAILVIPFFIFGFSTRLDFLIVGGFACLMYYGADARDALGWVLNTRPAVALGNWSYSIYLWHAPTHVAIAAAFAASGHPLSHLSKSNARLLLLGTALVVVGLSAAVYRYFETPMRRSMAGEITNWASGFKRG
jgi:peptidoglycan/LPS O-acetylase OafA/YrhL